MTGVAGAFAFGSWFGARMEQSRQPWARERLLSTALDSVRVNFLDSLPESELMRRAVSGMLRELHDPYAALLEREGIASYRGTLRGESQGLGLLLRLRGSSLLVRRVQPGSPAATAGVRAGDLVALVDGRRAVDAWSMPRPDAGVTDANGVSSDTIRLEIQRAGSADSVNVSLVRAPWRVTAVSDALLAAEGVGYARLASSASGSADELEKAVDRLVERGARSLILDLRGNVGGLYEEGVKAAGLFLSRGDVVASLERRGAPMNQVETVRNSRWPSLPIVLLVDGNTASSAEIIAAALRDHGRALLVGERTYGKGVVQRVVNINSELSLKMTTARWLPPSGVPLERRQESGGRSTGGLAPDVTISPSGRLDPSSVPPSLSPTMARTVSEVVDQALDAAIAEGWSTGPVVVLERRMREQIEPAVGFIPVDPARRVALVGDAVRVGVRRLLEMTRGDDVLWSYAAYDDPAFRAALDVVAPGLSTVAAPEAGAPLTTSSTLPGAASAMLSAVAPWLPALSGDSTSVVRLTEWATHRFFGLKIAPTDSVAIDRAVTTRPSPRIDGMLRAGVRDTVVAVHFAAGAFRPAFGAGAVVHLADPSGGVTALEGRVVARMAFRAPVAPGPSVFRPGDWRHAWAYLVELPPRSATAHSGGFAGWRVVLSP